MTDFPLLSLRLQSFGEKISPLLLRADGDGAESGVLPSARFDPLDFAEWLPDIVLAVADPGEDFVYKVYGENVATINGQNLRGKSLSSWPNEVSTRIRDQAAWIAENRRPTIIRYLGKRFSNSLPRQLESRSVACEKLMVPVQWHGQVVDGFLSVTTELKPDEIQAGRTCKGAIGCQCVPPKPSCDCTIFANS